MPRLSSHFATAGLSVLLLAATIPAQATDQAASPPRTSKVRIVRLSEVKGAVEVDRNIGRGFEPAMTNLPIVEKSRIVTGTGVAEVEFEDNSTLRLAPDSMVEFPQLERMATGATASSVVVLKGTAYVSLVKGQSNSFNLLFGQQKIELPPASHVRLQLKGNEAELAVLDGAVRINDPSGTMDVPRKKTVKFQLLEQEQPKVTKDIAPDTFDTWDKNSSAYHARTASLMAVASAPYAYGINDMSYYGSFMDAGGCGSMWRPYFASAAWDPYSNGAWAYYQGAGYSWVSPYPWGWTPYHYGSWSFCDGTGWGWQPGGGWNGLNNMAYGAASPNGGQMRRLPVAPVRPPRANEPTIAAVNLRPLVRSDLASANSFVFRKDSAGFGIPRDGMGKLNKFSQRAVNRGTASTAVYINVPTSVSANGRPVSSAIAAASIQRGSPMPSSTRMSSFGGGPSNMGGSYNGGGMGSRSVSAGPSGGGGPAPSSGSRAH